MSTIRMATHYGWYAEMDSADLPWDGHEIARIMADKVKEYEAYVEKCMRRINGNPLKQEPYDWPILRANFPRSIKAEAKYWPWPIG